MTEADYDRVVTGKRGAFRSSEVANNWAIPVVPRDDVKEMPEEMKAYLEKMIELCKNEGVELILYCAPFNSMYLDEASIESLFETQRVFNGVADVANEHGLRYYNMFYEIDQMGLDYSTDFMDSQHFNENGQAKFTRYMMDKGYFD